MFMTIGQFVLALFSCIFLLYTNSFLMKRRQKELGLYSVLGTVSYTHLDVYKRQG